jgi:two-component system, sensor histidine kinase LadS
MASAFHILIFFVSCLTLFGLPHFSCSGQAILLLDPTKIYDNLGTQTKVLKDTSMLLSVHQVASPAFAQHWQVATQANLNFGLDAKTAYWVSMEVEKSNTLPDDWLIEFANPFMDSLFVYQLNADSTFSTFLTGYFLPYTTRKVKHTGFTFPLHFGKQTKLTLYLRLSGHDPLLMPIQVLRQEDFFNQVRLQDVGYGIYFGILLVMLLYNSFLFYAIRDKNYLYYVFTIFWTFTVFAAVSGYLFMYFWQNTPQINYYIGRVGMCFLVITTSIFTKSFLQVRQYSRWLYYIYNFMIVAGVVVATVQFLNILHRMPNFLLSIHTPLLISTGIYCSYKGNLSARFFLIAWIFYIVGGLTIILRNIGLMPYNSLTTHGVEVGSALEVVLLSLALADRYRRLRKEKEQAQLQALAVQKEANDNLEKKVIERTIQLKETNEELLQTNEELHTTMETLEQKSEELRKTNEDITASINYAKRIQRAILLTDNSFRKYFPDSFIIFKPRDIVSGDFYWATQKEHLTIVAAADCTGHGVPGAFMSMIGNDILNQLVVEKNITQPNELLAMLNKSIFAMLKQDDNAVNDGMDIIICMVDKTNNYFQYAGAMNPLYYLDNQTFKEIKADKQSIGGHGESNKQFTLHTIPYNGVFYLYLFSDGYQDQFGGTENRKFMVKKLKALLASFHNFDLHKQKEILEYEFERWKGKQEQIDDVMAVVIKLTN